MKISVREEWREEMISKPDKVAEIIRKLLSEMDELDRDKEHIWVFHLNAMSEIESIEHVTTGIQVASIAHPREIFRRAIIEAATMIMLVHNHPSNYSEPSIPDNNLTEKIFKAGDVLGIPLIDHIIVASDEFYSYRKEGKL